MTQPSNLTVVCDGAGNEAELRNWLDNHAGATANDNWSTNLTWSHNFTGLTSACGKAGEALVTFTVSDECGNKSTVTATVKIEDETPPVFSALIPEIKVGCDEPIPVKVDPSVSDVCDAAPKVVFDEKKEAYCGNGYKLIRTWTATDACGNTATTVQTILYGDNEPPVLGNVPADITLRCDEPLPLGQGLTIQDKCDALPRITMSDNITRGACGSNYTIKRIWTAVDACGNLATAQQNIYRR
ncbi:MAG: hypothetical protein HC817_11025 [Saprospiraceae bacterium]|nr:hypothetical protein [Saprospiraceae bacterium]